MRNLVLVLGMFLAIVMGCGDGAEEPLAAQASTSVEAPASSRSPEQGLQSLGQDNVQNATLSTAVSRPRIETDGSTTEADGYGRWCTLTCPGGGCYQAPWVTWGHCNQTADEWGCWNARWCYPGQCC